MSHLNKRNYLPEVENGTYINNTQSHYRTTDFRNLTPFPVVILDRQNIPIVLPAAPAGTSMVPPRVEIRTHYQFFDQRSIQDMGGHITNMNTQLQSFGEERRILLDAINATSNDGIRNSINFTSVRKIPLRDIQVTNLLFDQSSGYVLTLDNRHLTAVHPESIEGKMVGSHEQYVQARPTGLLIEIVDNEKLIKERFTFASNNVIHIPAICDADRLSGVYITRVRDIGQSVSVVDTEKFSLIEAEVKFGLYRTHEEAQTNGNPELIAKHLVERTKLELEETKNKASLMEAENRQLETVYKKKFLKLETEQKEKIFSLEAKNKKKASEILRLKEQVEKRKLVRDEYFDTRSQERKDTSEMIKFIPAVLIGFIGAAVLFRK